MIGTALLYLIYFALSSLLLVLPSSSGLPQGVIDGFGVVIGYFKGFDFIIPTGTILNILSLTILFYGGLFLWRLIHWIYNKVRGI